MSKTFIFSDLDYVGQAFYHNVVKIARGITISTSKATFGFKNESAPGCQHRLIIEIILARSISWPSKQPPRSRIHSHRSSETGRIFLHWYPVQLIRIRTLDSRETWHINWNIPNQLWYMANSFPVLAGHKSKWARVLIQVQSTWVILSRNWLRKYVEWTIVADWCRSTNMPSPEVRLTLKNIVGWVDEQTSMSHINIYPIFLRMTRSCNEYTMLTNLEKCLPVNWRSLQSAPSGVTWVNSKNDAPKSRTRSWNFLCPLVPFGWRHGIIGLIRFVTVPHNINSF